MKWCQDHGQVLFSIAFWKTLLYVFPQSCGCFFPGQPEIIALSEILRVNCCVWEIRQGYAEVIFRHLLTNPILGTSTVHLNYASRRHYEFTDVGKVNTYPCKHILKASNIFFGRTLCRLKFLPTIIVDPTDHDDLVQSLHHNQLVFIADNLLFWVKLILCNYRHTDSESDRHHRFRRLLIIEGWSKNLNWWFKINLQK